MEYATLGNAITAVRNAGKGALLVKRDLAEAFRHIPVAASDWWLLGFQWGSQF